MIRHIAIAAALLAAPVPNLASAQDAEPAAAPSPGEIVARAAPSEWVAIDPQDLLVMTLTPGSDGKERRAVIQLMPPPFSQPWVENIRTLAKAHWWDGLAIVRVQDNYVVQWGDPESEDEAKARPLPEGLQATSEKAYLSSIKENRVDSTGAYALTSILRYNSLKGILGGSFDGLNQEGVEAAAKALPVQGGDSYAPDTLFLKGWPLAMQNDPEKIANFWPVHCYGMVGVGRGYSPDAGTGAELYTVIGHAPRHLDRNIAVVGRVVEGIEHLSSLPRGTGTLGFYETAEERVPIVSIRLASELPAAEQPKFEYLSTNGETFARYADARANRRDPFFIVPAGGADICNIPVPVRRVEEAPAE